MLATHVLPAWRWVPDHVLAVVGAEPRVLTKGHVQALACGQVDGVAWEPSHACAVDQGGVALVHARIVNGAAELVDRLVTADVHLLDGAGGACGVLRQDVVGLHLQHRATRPLAAVAGEDHVDAGGRLRGVPLLHALQVVTRGGVKRQELVRRTGGRVFDVCVGVRHHRVWRPRSTQEALVEFLLVHQVVVGQLVRRLRITLLGAGANPVVLHEAFGVRDALKPWLFRVGERDACAKGRGHLVAGAVDFLLAGDAKTPLQDELLVEHIDGAVAGDDGLGRVAGRHGRVEHRQFGQHPVPVLAFVQVASLAQDAELKLSVRHRKRVDDTHRHRTHAPLVSHRSKLARAAGNQRGLALRRQGDVVLAVALALQTCHRHAVAVSRRLNQAAALRRRLVRNAAVNTDRADSRFPGCLVLDVLSCAQNRIKVPVVVVSVGHGHEVVRLVVHQGVVALGEGVLRHPEAVCDAFVVAVGHELRNRRLHDVVVAVVHHIVDFVGDVALEDQTRLLHISKLCRVDTLFRKLVDLVAFERV